MTQPSPLATPEPWNLVSAAYAEEVMPMFSVYAEAALALAGVKAGERVLDVASGPGTLALLAARRGARVDALDFSPAMVELLRAAAAREAEERRRGGRVELAPDGHERPVLRCALRCPTRARSGTAVRRRGPAARSAERIRRRDGRSRLPRHRGARRSTSRVVCDAQEGWQSFQRTLAPLAMLARKMGAGWPPVSDRMYESLRKEFGTGPQTITMPAWLGVGRAP